MSVREIETDAFCNCRNLKRVVFAKRSRLERIGAGCFYGAEIEEITIPKGVEEISKRAF